MNLVSLFLSRRFFFSLCPFDHEAGSDTLWYVFFHTLFLSPSTVPFLYCTVTVVDSGLLVTGREEPSRRNRHRREMAMASPLPLSPFRCFRYCSLVSGVLATTFNALLSTNPSRPKREKISPFACSLQQGAERLLLWIFFQLMRMWRENQVGNELCCSTVGYTNK